MDSELLQLVVILFYCCDLFILISLVPRSVTVSWVRVCVCACTISLDILMK